MEIKIEENRAGKRDMVQNTAGKNPSVATCSNERRSGRTSKNTGSRKHASI
jgi:hypothetical protein